MSEEAIDMVQQGEDGAEYECAAYIGAKLINARPMTRLEYNQFRGWELPADENGDDAGYVVA